jgi:hypothetical protein
MGWTWGYRNDMCVVWDGFGSEGAAQMTSRRATDASTAGALLHKVTQGVVKYCMRFLRAAAVTIVALARCADDEATQHLADKTKIDRI